VREATEHYERYRLNDAASTAYHFLWSDVADWYLEAVKPRLYGTAPGGEAARAVAAHVFELGLRLLHPVMPFITETLWLRLPQTANDGALLTTPWPEATEPDGAAAAQREFAALQAVVGAVRALRAEYGVAPGRELPVLVTDASDAVRAALAAESETARRLAKLESIAVVSAAPAEPGGTVVL